MLFSLILSQLSEMNEKLRIESENVNKQKKAFTDLQQVIEFSFSLMWQLLFSFVIAIGLQCNQLLNLWV